MVTSTVSPRRNAFDAPLSSVVFTETRNSGSLYSSRRKRVAEPMRAARLRKVDAVLAERHRRVERELGPCAAECVERERALRHRRPARIEDLVLHAAVRRNGIAVLRVDARGDLPLRGLARTIGGTIGRRVDAPLLRAGVAAAVAPCLSERLMVLRIGEDQHLAAPVPAQRDLGDCRRRR